MNKYWVVGGSAGIGAALVHQLLNAGHEVWSFARNPYGHPPSNGQIHEISLDILNDALPTPPDVLHGLAYCPGSIHLAPFHRLQENDFRQDWLINVLGAIKTIQKALPALKAAQSASVVCFSTVAVQTGMAYHASIASAKGALEGLIRSLAAEYAPNGIRFNGIAPSLTDTRLAEKLLASDEKKAASAKRHPLGRYGKAEDLASLAAFLLQDSASWITGQIIHADGGMSSLRML